MAEEWLVDGCNLLHAYPSGRSPKKKKDRATLLHALCGFTAVNGLRMQVVLDGVGDSAELDTRPTTLFGVIYSQNASADTCIERLLYERRGQADFTVVTDDRAIGRLARGGGARVMGTGAFLDLMKASRKESSESLDKGKLRSHGFHRPFEDKLKDP